MRLTDASFEIAGGVILFLMAMGMAFPGMGVSLADSGHGGEPMLVPPAIPVITGPPARPWLDLGGRDRLAAVGDGRRQADFRTAPRLSRRDGMNGGMSVNVCPEFSDWLINYCLINRINIVNKSIFID
ncbi:hypothetical protein LP415_02270 [Polaromonas sp. P1(28)-8]|nr:hypothetical protein LP415_02270 [Polaromonas sp. P1(28)-8]